MLPDELNKERRLWGIDPSAVERALAEYDRDLIAVRSRLSDFENRVANVTTQRDEALRRAANEQTVLQKRVADLGTQLAIALERAEASEEEVRTVKEPRDRIAVMREEAMQYVAESWAKARTLEENAQQVIERTRGELLAEAAKLRAQQDADTAKLRARQEEERQGHEAELERLQKQRVQMLSELEATARGVLDHATLIRQRRASVNYTSSLDLALRTLDEAATTQGADMVVAPEQSAPSAPPENHPSTPAGSAADTPSALRNSSATPEEPPRDTAMLTNALDELEALLKLPRDHWEAQTQRKDDAPPGD